MYTSPSPLPRRDPLRLPFSVHIRKLFFLFSQLRSLHHPPLIPHLSHRRSGHASRRGWGLSLCLPCRGPVLAPRRGRRPRRPAHVSSMSPTGRVPRSRARVTFGRSGPLIFLFYASGGHISFAAGRNGAAGGKNLRNRPVPSGTESGGKGVFRARKRGILLSAAGRNGAAGGKKRDGRFKASVSFFLLLMPRNSGSPPQLPRYRTARTRR